MKKWFIVLNALVFSLWSVGVSAQTLSHQYSHTSSLVEENRVSTLSRAARDYIATIEPYDENWKGLHPVISGDPVPYFVDDIHDPFTYEYKVSCDRSKDCGSVVVMIIGDETRVVQAATFGEANYEKLLSKNSEKNAKLYYYSPFNQYSQGKNGTIVSINPEESKKNSEEQSEILDVYKQKWTAYLQNNTLSFYKNYESVELDASEVPYVNGVLHVQAMPSDTSCQSFKLPCYDQFYQWYDSDGGTCASGCSPTAMAIIFGYYDRLQVFPNLIGNAYNIAPGSGNSHPDLVNMVNSIRGYMATFCDNGLGATYTDNIALGMQYARDRGYVNSPNGNSISAGGAFLFPRIRQQINGAKPVIANFQTNNAAHTVVVLGYNNTGNIDTSQLYINVGWGAGTPEQYVSAYHPITGSVGMDGYRIYNIVTVPVTW